MIFEDLDLIVKFGPYVTVTEAQCLWMLKRIFKDKVPVPEIFGWHMKGIMYSFVWNISEDKTLKARWDDLDGPDKTALSG